MAHRIFLLDSTALDSIGGCLNIKIDICSSEDSFTSVWRVRERSDQADRRVLTTRLGLVCYCAWIMFEGLSENR